MRSIERSRRRRTTTTTKAAHDNPIATASPWLTGLIVGGAIALAAGQAVGQVTADEGDLATGDVGIAADPVAPPGIDTVVGDDPDLGADLGVDGTGVGVLDDRDVTVGADITDPGVVGPGIDSRGVTVERDLGVMTKSPNIGGAVTSQDAEVIDDDDTLVGRSQDAATLADDLAEDEDDAIGAAPRLGVAESPLDADGAATTTLD